MKPIHLPLHFSFAVLLAIMVCAGPGSWAAAQELPGTAPAPAPGEQTTPQRPRHVAQVPPGFERVEIDGRSFFVTPDDRAWVTPAVQQATPPEMPTTMPADLLHNLAQRREQIRQRLSTDLGLDPGEVDRYLDERIKHFLEQMDELRPPLIYLVASPQQLKDAMRAGWTDPRYHYNRAADDVNFSTTVNLSLDEPGDDMVLPLLFDPAQPPEQRQQRVIREMQVTESSILAAVSQRTQAMMMVGMVDLISQKVLDPLELKPDQEWFGVGVAGVFGARYAAALIGLGEEQLLENMIRPDPQNPMRPETLDLLHPTDLSDLRPEWVAAYADAYRRRSMHVIWKLVSNAGEGAVGKVLAAMRKSPPADGAALAQLIQQVTGVDLSGDLQRR